MGIMTTLSGIFGVGGYGMPQSLMESIWGSEPITPSDFKSTGNGDDGLPSIVWDDYSKSWVLATPTTPTIPSMFLVPASFSKYLGAFNPGNVGVWSHLKNSMDVALEKAKQEDTPPKITTYGPPLSTGSGGNSGMGGVVGWFGGIPQYFINLREKDKEDWEDYKLALEDRKRLNKNREEQEVISDKDENDPWVTFAGASGEPSEEASIWEKTDNTWDDFIGGVKSGWEAGGLTNYKTPLLIAGGVVLLILLIK